MKWRILIPAVMVLASIAALGQSIDSAIYVKNFPGLNVGAKVTNAMATCGTNAAVPCILVIDPSLAAAAPGALPTLCGHCYLMDFRSGPPSLAGMTQLDTDVLAGPGSGLQHAHLKVVNSGPGSCGDSTHVCAVVTDANGRVTSQTPIAIAGGGGGGSTNVLVSQVANLAGSRCWDLVPNPDVTAPSTCVYHNATTTAMFVVVSGDIGGGGFHGVVYSDSSATPTTMITQFGRVNAGSSSPNFYPTGAGFFVPAGNYYGISVTNGAGTPAIKTWTEYSITTPLTGGGGGAAPGLATQVGYYAADGTTISPAAHFHTDGSNLAFGLAGAFGCAYNSVLCEDQTDTTNLGASSYNFSNEWNPATTIRSNGVFYAGGTTLTVNLDGQATTDTNITATAIGITNTSNTTQVGSLNAVQIGWLNQGNGPILGSGGVSYNAQNFSTALTQEFLGFSGAYQAINGHTDHVATFEDEGIHTSNSAAVGNFQAFHSYFAQLLGTSHVGEIHGVQIDAPQVAPGALLDSAVGYWLEPQAAATSNFGYFFLGPEPSFSGGPVTAGGLFTHNLGSPANPAGTPSISGGTILNGTYYFKIVALDVNSLVTLPSNESSAVVTTGTNVSSIALTWNGSDPAGGSGAQTYEIWMGTSSGAEDRYFTVSALSVGCLDSNTTPTCTATLTQPYTSGTSGALPAVNTSGKLRVNHAFVDAIATSPSSLPICAGGTNGELTNGGCNPAFPFVLTQTVSGTSTSVVTFPSIPGTATSLEMECTGTVSDAAEIENLSVNFNADSSASHYQWSRTINDGTTISAGVNAADTRIFAGYFDGSTAATGSTSSLKLKIPQYASTALATHTAYEDNLAMRVAGPYMHAIMGSWMPTSAAAISRIDLTDTGGGHFTAGTTCTLRGLP